MCLFLLERGVYRIHDKVSTVNIENCEEKFIFNKSLNKFKQLKSIMRGLNFNFLFSFVCHNCRALKTFFFCITPSLLWLLSFERSWIVHWLPYKLFPSSSWALWKERATAIGRKSESIGSNIKNLWLQISIINFFYDICRL